MFAVALKDLKSLRLAGVFEYLAGHFTEETANAYLVKGRHANDLPEMQTFAAYDEGRFAYWRFVFVLFF
ncbi:unnamed protein product [Anisakis simplex]|uniref:Integrase n=1 Tax=Anisakis simplex TaxID=6269 RepID=A0A0M3JPN6_ANISI|nr:unnamed protein product [Anisakis simplex]